MNIFNKCLTTIYNSLKSMIFDDSVNLITTEDKVIKCKCESPFYILKLPVTLNLWRAMMPYYNHSTMSWNEMQQFIEKLGNKLNVKFSLPTSVEWRYACLQYPILKENVSKAEISFWIYNRPYGTIIDSRCPYLRKYDQCDGTENLPEDLFLSVGMGHDTVALFLITNEDCKRIQKNELLNSEDFYYIK